MKRVEKVLERISMATMWLGIGLTLATMAMYSVDVFGRLMFSVQNRGTFEIAQFMLCLITFTAFAYTQMMRGHIHVSILINRFPKGPKYLTTTINFAICAFICTVVTFSVHNMGVVALANGRHSQVVALPFAPLYFACTVIMAVFTATIVFDVIRSIRALAGNPDARASIDKVFSQ